MKRGYYSTNKILQIMKMYHTNLNNLQTLQKEMRSVGVSQYGIEASLPKGNDISSVVENEALRQIENTKMWSDIITDMKYIQDRWYRITDEKEAMVMHFRLSGYSVTDISQEVNMHKSHVYRLLVKVAERISYPQANESNETNLEKTY